MVSIVKKQMQMRGMGRQELINYFLETGGIEVKSGFFIGKHVSGVEWQVYISNQAIHKVGSLRLPSTTVTIRTEAAEIDGFIADFRMKFLSAGG